MIEENIYPNWKLYLAREGDARVFGEQSDVRRQMDDPTALRHFAEVWNDVLEPELRGAPEITIEEAAELVEGKQREYVRSGHQYRWFSLYSVPFIAWLNSNADEDGTCDQLWPLGVHRDNTRLCMHFASIPDKERFDRLARRLGWKPKELVLKFVTDFMNKFPEGFV